MTFGVAIILFLVFEPRGVSPQMGKLKKLLSIVAFHIKVIYVFIKKHNEEGRKYGKD